MPVFTNTMRTEKGAVQMASQWLTIPVDGEPMWAYMSLPDTPGPYPAVIVAQHGAGAGVDDWVQDMTRRLAAAGYVAVAPHLFHREDPEAVGDPPLSRIGRLRDDGHYLGRQRHHRPAAPASVGAGRPRRDHRLLHGGARDLSHGGSQPPHQGGGGLLRGEHSGALGRSARRRLTAPAAFTCPVIGFFGEDDTNPTPADVAQIEAELTRHGKVHRFYSYPDTGHSFQWHGTPAYRAHAAGDSWDKLLDWFQKYLRA